MSSTTPSGPVDGGVAVWADALDEFEHRLDRFDALLAHGADPEVSGTWPAGPARDVPLPAELGDRARTLLRRADEVTERLVAAREALHRPATNHRRHPSRRSSFFAEL